MLPPGAHSKSKCRLSVLGLWAVPVSTVEPLRSRMFCKELEWPEGFTGGIGERAALPMQFSAAMLRSSSNGHHLARVAHEAAAVLRVGTLGISPRPQAEATPVTPSVLYTGDKGPMRGA